MSFFGFSSKKEVEEKERQAREEARRQAMGDLAERDKRTRSLFCKDSKQTFLIWPKEVK